MNAPTITTTEARLQTHEADVVRSFLSYDPDTGVFKRIKASGWVMVGSRVGCVSGRYLQINVGGKRYRAHQLAWLIVHGYIPKEIDHINGNGLDNRISNLREVTHQQNSQNYRVLPKHNTSGYLGVSYYKAGNKYAAHLNIDGKKKHLGYFDKAFDAHRRYLEVKRQTHTTCTI